MQKIWLSKMISSGNNSKEKGNTFLRANKLELISTSLNLIMSPWIKRTSYWTKRINFSSKRLRSYPRVLIHSKKANRIKPLYRNFKNKFKNKQIWEKTSSFNPLILNQNFK